jgi:hypothetical protein
MLELLGLATGAKPVIGTGGRTDVADVLRRCQMPEDEIRWVITAEDPSVVHMILELHRERLEDELDERRKALGELETWLIRSRDSG